MMNRVELQNYNLASTLLGGQSFVWDFYPEDDFYIGKTQRAAVKLKYDGKYLYWQTYPEKDNWEYVRKYLRLDADYDKIIQTIDKDDHVKVAMKKYPGLRILKQDFEEALLGFIISPQNNIRSIRRSIAEMSKSLGEEVDVDGLKVNLFPKTEVIAATSLEKLLGFSLGFHAKFLKGAAEKLIREKDKIDFTKLDELQAREELKKFSGIGDKVADCILVYSLAYDTVTPLDVWGLRIAHDLYGLDPKLNYEEKRKWLSDYFEGYAAWAGQFLFEYIRGFEV